MTQTKEKWWWPPVNDLSEAVDASNKGVWAAGVVAAITFAILIFSQITSSSVVGVDAWAIVDVIFFGLIAWGIYRRSRICAVLGLFLFIVGKILQLAAFGLGLVGLGIAGFFVVLFLV
jgi:hypothetical protein